MGIACNDMGRRPQLVKSELRELRLDRGVRSRLRKLHGTTI